MQKKFAYATKNLDISKFSLTNAKPALSLQKVILLVQGFQDFASLKNSRIFKV